MSSAIKVKGLKEILAKIDRLEDMEGVKNAMRAAAIHVEGKAKKYPPESEANLPGRVPYWYERGWGTRWPLAGGGVGGRQTSETLGRKWTIKSRNSGLTQVIGNNVSYGIYVQGPDDQAVFHQRRGWKTTDDVAKEESNTVLDFIQREVDRILEGD